MAVRDDFTAGEVLAAADLNDTFGAKANLASPTFTGTPAAPTAAAGTNTTQLATTAFARSAGGLVHIATESFTAVSSVSLNGVFTSAYDNYAIMIKTTGTQNDALQYRMRAGSDNTASSYNYIRFGIVSSTLSGAPTTSDDKGGLGQVSNAQISVVWSQFFSPFLSEPTVYVAKGNQFADSTFRYYDYSGSHNVASSFDGITLYPASGTITGTIRVYGHQNS
jgi:hypothetical protein